MLWLHPATIGRVGFDARMELYSAPELSAYFDFVFVRGHRWQRVTAGYGIIVASRAQDQGLAAALGSLPADGSCTATAPASSSGVRAGAVNARPGGCCSGLGPRSSSDAATGCADVPQDGHPRPTRRLSRPGLDLANDTWREQDHASLCPRARHLRAIPCRHSPASSPT